MPQTWVDPATHPSAQDQLVERPLSAQLAGDCGVRVVSVAGHGREFWHASLLGVLAGLIGCELQSSVHAVALVTVVSK